MWLTNQSRDHGVIKYQFWGGFCLLCGLDSIIRPELSKGDKHILGCIYWYDNIIMTLLLDF